MLINGNVWYYAYIVLSVLAVGCFIYSIQCKEKKNILLFQFLSCVFYAIIYLYKGAWSGLVTQFIQGTKNALFYQYEKRKLKNPLFLLFLFAAFIILFSISTYDGPLSLIPAFISLAYLLGTYIKNPKAIRIIVLICGILWIFYNAYAKAYIFIIGNVIEVISGFVALYRFRNKKRKTTK